MACRRRLLYLLLGCIFAAPLTWMAAGQEATAPKSIEWRTDYNQALIESEKRGLPIVIDFTMTPCFYCDKLEATTFRDPRIIKLMNQNFVPLKIHKERDGKLTNDMRISGFPTLVIAGPGRKILKMQEGYLDADSFHEMLQNHVVQVAVSPPDWMKQQYDQAYKAYQEGQFARAHGLLKNILEDSKNKALHAPAQKLLGEIEGKANERLVQAKSLADAGKSVEAIQTLTETLVTFPGSSAAKDAGAMLTKLTQHHEERSKHRHRRAGELISQAREYYKSKEIVPCLDRCETLLASYGDLPEGLEASQLIQEIKANSEWLQLAADTLTDRLAGVWLAQADNMIKRARPRDAEAFLRRVILAFPGTRYAESAQIRIGQLQGIPASRVDISSNPE